MAFAIYAGHCAADTSVRRVRPAFAEDSVTLYPARSTAAGKSRGTAHWPPAPASALPGRRPPGTFYVAAETGGMAAFMGQYAAPGIGGETGQPNPRQQYGE